MKQILFPIVCIILLSAVFAEAMPVNKNTQLIRAAKAGNLQDVQAALAEGADVDAKNSDGETALILASRLGHTEVVKFLLKKRPNLNVKTNLLNNTPLMWASWHGHTDIVRLLLDNGADVNASGKGYTALIHASSSGHTEVVKLLLENGANANIKTDNRGFTALLLASGGGHTEIVRLLLNKGADIDARINVDGVTSLILAARFGHTEIVKLLLGKGVNAKDKKAALWEAKSMRNVKVVEILEAAGAKE